MNSQLWKDLEKARELQQDYEYGDENWKWYQRQIDALEAEALKQEEDDRYRLRSWKPEGGVLG